jgi:DNA processing protein
MSKTHYLALSRISGVGGATARKLIDRFGTLARAFDADEHEMLSIPRVTPEIVRSMREFEPDSLESELDALDGEGIGVLTWEDDDYPANLQSAPDAPVMLYVVGDILPDDERAIAIVGTREPSGPAVEQAESMAARLASKGFTIVSGLAPGIDTAAHRGALRADAGRTLAVLGSGVRMIHPRENVELAREIAGRGAVISEYHPNTPVKGPQLMARDRIVSGLSLAVIVVEAGSMSGSVDTAEKARRQGRKVFAVPGSPGCDELIASGARSLDPGDLDALIAGASAESDEPQEQLGLW